MATAAVYWDANAFLSYINGLPDRMPVLDALLGSSAGGSIQIYTSAISQVEVAFAASEQRQKALDADMERKINSLWDDPKAVVLVEYHDGIGREARSLIRDAVTYGWSLKPLDAIHLATAQWLSQLGYSVSEFHTYDHSLPRYTSLVGYRICEPYSAQPSMI